VTDYANLDAPEVVLKELVRREWEDTNVDGITPEVRHGWLDDEKGEIQVTIGNPEESPIQGGQSGYAATRGDGSGPVQMMDGTTPVNCWTARGWTGVNDNGGNPAKVAWLMQKEVRRILHAHDDGTDADGNETSLDVLAPLGKRRFVDDHSDEWDVPILRYRVLAGYGYHVDPP